MRSFLSEGHFLRTAGVSKLIGTSVSAILNASPSSLRQPKLPADIFFRSGLFAAFFDAFVAVFLAFFFFVDFFAEFLGATAFATVFGKPGTIVGRPSDSLGIGLRLSWRRSKRC